MTRESPPTILDDATIKKAFARALQIVSWDDRTLPRPGINDRFALREIVVPLREDVVLNWRREQNIPIDDPNREFNMVLAEVIVFCPIPLPGWQCRAEIVLKEHLNSWRNQLSTVRAALVSGGPIHTVPFGRILSRNERPDHWVRLEKVSVRRADFFENWSDPSQMQDTFFLKRPFLLWPTDRPGSLTHVTHIEGRRLSIERPSLDHPLLRQPRQ